MATHTPSYLSMTPPTSKGRSLSFKIFTPVLLIVLAISAVAPAKAQCSLTLTPVNIQNATCGGSEGFFQVNVSGITAPYQYWLYKDVSGTFVLQENGTLIAGTLTFVGLTAGSFRVDVSKDGCSGSAFVTITQAALTLTPTNIQNASCGGKEGFFQVQATGITAPYQYWLYKDVNGTQVLQENGTLIAGTLTFVGLGAGTYTVDVSKGSNCRGSTTVEITQPALTLTASNIRQPTCGGTDGFFQVQATGITAPYQYWLYKDVSGTFVLQENGTLIAGTLTFVGLDAGTYKVDVSKGGNCSGSTIVVLNQEELVLTPVNIRQPTCGATDGNFQVQATGITAPYQYWLYKDVNGSPVLQENGTLIAGTLTFVGLGAGIYTVDVSKGGNCRRSTTVTLAEQPLTMTLGSLTFPSCQGNNGSFSVQTTGIATPYQYTLYKNINGNLVSQQSGTLIAGTLSFTGLSTGIYTVTITKGTCTQSLDVYVNCEVIGSEGCGPGYWKTHTSAWLGTNYSPGQTVESVFNVPDAFGLDNVTLLEALQSPGGPGLLGGAKILLRQAVAAVLNAAHADVDYSITLQQIITSVNTALASTKPAMLTLASQLDTYNNLNCPLNLPPNTITQNRDAIPGAEQLATGPVLQVKALPNPSSGTFYVTIESNSTDKISVKVVDMMGRVIEQRKQVVPNQPLRFGGVYTAGIYILEVEQGVNKKQVRLVKTD